MALEYGGSSWGTLAVILRANVNARWSGAGASPRSHERHDFRK